MIFQVTDVLCLDIVFDFAEIGLQFRVEVFVAFHMYNLITNVEYTVEITSIGIRILLDCQLSSIFLGCLDFSE